MRSFRELFCRVIVLASFLFISTITFAQQSSATLRGQVADELGGLVVGATVTVADASGVQKSTTTDDQGRYSFSSLAPGVYTVRATAPGFSTFENTNVDIRAVRTDPFNITLPLTIEQQTVTGMEDGPISTELATKRGAGTLRGT